MNGVRLFFVLSFLDIGFNFWGKLFEVGINRSSTIVMLNIKCFTVSTGADSDTIDPSIFKTLYFKSLPPLGSNIEPRMKVVASKFTERARKLNGNI